MSIKVTEIARSFSQTIQYRQFEPINIFASYKGEIEGEDAQSVAKFSEYLFQLAKADVLNSMNKTLAELKANEAELPPF